MSEEEFWELAEKIRVHTQDNIKMEPQPWLRDYFIDMDKLYCELTLHKIEKEAHGPEPTPIRHYTDVFTGGRTDPKGKNVYQTSTRVLGKGDPGMGKTTLAKRIVWEWARKIFDRFVVVFFVFLKLVSPSDAIESVIMEQNKWLVGLGCD